MGVSDRGRKEMTVEKELRGSNLYNWWGKKNFCVCCNYFPRELIWKFHGKQWKDHSVNAT
jgi:hypothetical protein